jgi:beta-phosphoglucomutase-like phosphatase (HAD superfamily)
MLIESVTISRRDFDAAIFDLDGVLTDTAGIHADVEAGKSGGFKCVVGIDHGQQSTALSQHGADIVINSLRDVHAEN